MKICFAFAPYSLYIENIINRNLIIMKKIYSLILILIFANACQNNQESNSSKKDSVVEIGSAMMDGTDMMTPIIVGEVSNQATWLDYINAHNEKNLDFEASSITVVHPRSTKGLEFDVVILLDMEGLKIRDADLTRTCKQLYVNTSRARERLFICFVIDSDNFPESLGLLPTFKDDDTDLYTIIPQDKKEALKGILGKTEIPIKNKEGE